MNRSKAGEKKKRKEKKRGKTEKKRVKIKYYPRLLGDADPSGLLGFRLDPKDDALLAPILRVNFA